MRIHHPSKKGERGVTILIVAMSLLVLVTMAALAIDIASLYQARGEAQRAADAAALAGAKMFVTSSYTSTTSLAFASVCHTGGPGSTIALNKQAEAAAKVNPIAGQPAVINKIQCDNTNVLNPRVTVTVESASSPTFFSKIWAIWGSTSIGTVKATASAEAYNASGQNLPILVTNVKPWLIPNCNPNVVVGGGAGNLNCSAPGGNHYDYLINPDGTIRNPGSFIGNVLQLSRQPTGALGVNSGALLFYGLRYPTSPPLSCPSTGAVSCDNPVNKGEPYIDAIACINSLQMSCGQKIGPTETPQMSVEVTSPLTGQPTVEGTKCLIHADGSSFNQGQDEISSGVPPVINGGFHNPNPSLQVPNISRSDSVITAPIYDGHQMCFDGGGTIGACNNASPTSATVIGFLQLGIQQTNGSQLLSGVSINAVGCSPSAIAAYPPTNSISAGGASPIPVRLVQTP